MKNNNCFYCLNHGKGELAENKGWYYPCKLEIPNEGLHDLQSCPKWKPCNGFQIGGYYSHMHFECTEPDDCLEWVIHSDGAFPTDDPSRMISLHICDFRQIEEWVAFWGAHLRDRGLITANANRCPDYLEGLKDEEG